MKYHLPGSKEQPVTPDDAEHASRLEARGWVAIPEQPPVGPETPPHYHDPIESIDLDVSAEAQGRFTSLIALIREALDLGAITPDSLLEIRDVHGNVHTLSVLRIRGLMLRYGLHCKALFDQQA